MLKLVVRNVLGFKRLSVFFGLCMEYKLKNMRGISSINKDLCLPDTEQTYSLDYTSFRSKLFVYTSP